MIPLDSIRGFFPPELRAPAFSRHVLKEYVECLALDWIARSPWARRRSPRRPRRRSKRALRAFGGGFYTKRPEPVTQIFVLRLRGVRTATGTPMS